MNIKMSKILYKYSMLLNMLEIITELLLLSVKILSLRRFVRDARVVFVITIVNRRIYLYYLLL